MVQRLVRVEMFGGLKVFHGETPRTRFRDNNAKLLFAFLLLHRHKPVSRETILSKLYTDDLKGNRHLTHSLSDLRMTVEPEGIARHSIIIADPKFIRLNMEALITDVDEFDHALQHAEQATVLVEKIRFLQHAFELYRGTLLYGIDEGWVRVEQLNYEDAYEKTACHLAWLYRDGGHPREAERLLRRAKVIYPTSSKIKRTLKRLEVQVNSISEEEQSDELAPSDDEPPQSIDLRQGQINPDSNPLLAPYLPVCLGLYVGRHTELELVMRMLTPASPELHRSRLITLHGLAGIGKTRLAAETGHALLEAYQGRIYFVSLAEQMTGQNLAQAVLSQLPIQPSSEHPVLEQLTQFLNQGPTLLILDNLEQILEPAAAFIQSLLKRCPALQCLTTSRHPLGLNGEQVIELKPLSLNRGERGKLSESLTLFRDRVQSRNPTLHWSERTLQLAEEMCALVEGIPFAIELAAARAAVHPNWNLLAQSLLSAIKTQAVQARTSSERHGSVITAIQWSYQLLSHEVQQFLKGLSVFRGSWTLQAAEQVCQEPRACEYLTMLRMHALIGLSETDRETRYSMQVVVREFLQEQLSNEEWHALRQNHAAYYGATSCAMLDYKPIEIDYLNYLSAFDYSLETSHIENCRQVINACVTIWQFTLQHETGLHYMERYLQMLSQSAASSIEQLYRELHGFAEVIHFLMGMGRVKEAAVFASRMEERLKRIDTEGLIDADNYRNAFLNKNALGWFYYHIGDSKKAREYHLGARDIAAAWNDCRLLATVETRQGAVEMADGYLHRAANHYASYPADLQGDTLMNRVEHAYVLMDIACLSRLLGDYPRSEQLYDRSLELHRQDEHDLGILQCLRDRSLLRMEMGRYEEARTDLHQALTLLENRHTCIRISIHTYLGEIALAQGDWIEARKHLESGLSFWRKYPHPRWQAHHLARLALLNLYKGQNDSAAVRCEEGLDQLRTSPSLIIEAQLRYILGLAQGQDGEPNLLNALGVSLESGHRLGMMEGVEALAYHYFQTNRACQALPLLQATCSERSVLNTPLHPTSRCFYRLMFDALPVGCAGSPAPDLEKVICQLTHSNCGGRISDGGL